MRQHFVPILHLKHFAGQNPKGQVWSYGKNGKTFSAIPDNTAVQTHYYSVDGPGNAKDLRLETILSEIESDAAPVYDDLLQGKVPTKKEVERSRFASFLAVMYLRTPAMRRMGAEFYSQWLQTLTYAYATNKDRFDALTRDMEKTTGKLVDEETKEKVRQEFLNPTDDYKLVIPKQQTFTVFMAGEKLAHIFFDMKWSLCFAEHGYYVTSDHPIVRIVTGGDHPIYGDHGFLNRTAEVSFPLTPKLMLIMSWKEDAKEIGVLERQHVQYLNRLRAEEAEQWVYAHLQDQRIVRLVAQFAKSRRRMSQRGFGPKTFTPVEVRR